MTKLEIFKKLQRLKEYEKIKKSIDKKKNYLYNNDVKNEKEE